MVSAVGKQCGAVGGTIQPHVDVAVASHFELAETVNRAEFINQFLGNGFRRFLQLFRKMEGDWHGEFAELGLARFFDRNGNFSSVANGDVRRHQVPQLIFFLIEHGNYEYNGSRVCRALPRGLVANQVAEHAPVQGPTSVHSAPIRADGPIPE